MVGTEPDTFAVVEDFRGPVRFVFDERLSERVTGSVDDLVTVSPRTGDVRVSVGRNDVTVEVAGGFAPGQVYRVTLRPAVSDLFSNALRDPFELVFSTGGEFHPNALAGFAWDRLTADGVDDARIVARQVDDTMVAHVARSDGDGLYAFRYLPPGRYDVLAFLDRNRNGELDPMEPRGGIRPLIGAADTILADVPLLTPDTSAAQVVGVDVVGDRTLVVRFDDFLDPAISVRSLGIGIRPDSGASEGLDVPRIERVYHIWEYNRWVDEVADSFARLDSLEAVAAAARRDSVAAAAEAAAAAEPVVPPDTVAMMDTTGVDVDTPAANPAVVTPTPAVADTPRVAPPERVLPPRVEVPGERPRVEGEPLRVPTEGAPDRLDPLPQRRVVARLDRPLPANEPFRILVTGVRNINGLPQGGGTAVFVRQPPPPDTTAAADSAAAPVDTAVVSPDSASVTPDSAAVPPDSAAASPDSAAVPADSATVPPDSASVPRMPPARTRP